jgi:hypothetical protein
MFVRHGHFRQDDQVSQGESSQGMLWLQVGMHKQWLFGIQSLTSDLWAPSRLGK